MGVDWRINIDQAWMDISYRSAIQGNLDPVALFAPLHELRTKVHELLKRTGTRPGAITFAVAPTASLAGGVQIVAPRSIIACVKSPVRPSGSISRSRVAT